MWFLKASYIVLIILYPVVLAPVLPPTMFLIIAIGVTFWIFIAILLVALGFWIFSKNIFKKNHAKNIFLILIQIFLSYPLANFLAGLIDGAFDGFGLLAYFGLQSLLYFNFFLPKLREGGRAARAGTPVDNPGWVFARRPQRPKTPSNDGAQAQQASDVSGSGGPTTPKLTQVGSITHSGRFSLRVAKLPVEAADGKDELALEVKGSPSIRKKATVVVVTSILDVTENPSAEIGLPVEARTDAFREPMLPCYQFHMPPVEMNRGGGFIDWQVIAPVSPHLLKPPMSGKRLLRAVVRFIDLDNPSDIFAGIVDPNGPKPVCEYKHEFELIFDEPGYLEDIENRKLQRPLYVRLAMGIAMSDGSLDDAEGSVVSAWIRKQVDAESDEEKAAATKEACNSALRQAFADAEAGKLSVEDVCADIKKVSSSSDRYEVLELCLDVLAADGVADSGEMNFLRRTAKYLELDLDEFRGMLDKVIGGLETPEAVDLQAKEAEAGIDPDASIEEKKKELRKAFREWNAREAAATNKADKDRAQKRINTLGELRKLYSDN